MHVSQSISATPAEIGLLPNIEDGAERAISCIHGTGDSSKSSSYGFGVLHETEVTQLRREVTVFRIP